MPLEERFLRIADRFLELIKSETGRNTIICDENGVIVRSSIPSRIGDVHAGAVKIMRHEVDEYFVTAEESAANPLVHEGLNSPIVVNGRRVGTFGIAGKSDTSRPLVRVAAVLLASWLEDLERDSTALVVAQGRRRAHVLWVESEDSSWMEHRGLLASAYELIFAKSCEEALAMTQDTPPDVVLCDFDVPDLRGTELLDKMKRNAALKAIPFVILASTVSDEKAVGYLEAEAADVVAPSTGAYLRARIDAAVRAYRTHQQRQADQKNLARMITHSARSEARLRGVIEGSLDAIVLLGVDEKIVGVNATAERVLGYAQADVVGKPFLETYVGPSSRTRVAEAMSRRGQRVGRGSTSGRWEIHGLRRNGQEFPMECSFAGIKSGLGTSLCAFMRDVTDSQRMELELHEAQKLEAVGRLAAGVAHEINTPIQFIGDNTQFLKEALASLWSLLDAYAQRVGPESRDALLKREREIDLSYLREQVPDAIDSMLDGVQRVATIVRAMKEFAHPDQKEMVAVDLNRILQATLVVARNEYKYVATVDTDFGELPHVTCHVGELNQVFLNVLVNAAHAVANVVKGTEDKGKIGVATRLDGEQVVVSISDTGPGIPEDVRAKIFEPFFTTKEVGRGTGQGLAIARTIVQRHQGSISFQSEVGKGTTFHIRIPVEPVPGRAREMT